MFNFHLNKEMYEIQVTLKEKSNYANETFKQNYTKQYLNEAHLIEMAAV